MDGPLTARDAAQIWGYDPNTGLFVWKVTPSQAVRAGDRAGALQQNGYVYLRFRRKYYKAHRVAWLLMTGEWPSGPLDHKNLVRRDNRFSNLRLATCAQNVHHSPKRTNNTSGYKGASFHKKTGKFQASIRVHGKQVYLGLFATAKEANDAYTLAARKAYGDFATA